MYATMDKLYVRNEMAKANPTKLIEAAEKLEAHAATAGYPLAWRWVAVYADLDEVFVLHLVCCGRIKGDAQPGFAHGVHADSAAEALRAMAAKL